jgi:hypothetical protein
MGYMGFGMQSWIYTMRPRKPFKGERSKVYGVNPIYKKTFQLKHRPTSDNKSLGIQTLIIVGLILILSFFAIQSLKEYHIERAKISTYKYGQHDRGAYNFLVQSGDHHLSKGRLEAALKEYNLAEKIFPNSKKVEQLKLIVLSELCKDNISYYNQLEAMLQKPN